MPQTLSCVLFIIETLNRLGVSPVTLLIVPGSGWDRPGLETLRDLDRSGYHLAGHGWNHTGRQPKTTAHKLHSAVISKGAAEHLSRAPGEVVRLIQQCFDWFSDNNLSPPALYVPPAWAMGPVAQKTLDRVPFKLYETLSGIYDAESGTFRRLPLVGFEADSSVRIHFLRIFNAINRWLSARLGLPCRVAIHPHDFQLGLGEHLLNTVKQFPNFIDYLHIAATIREEPA